MDFKNIHKMGSPLEIIVAIHGGGYGMGDIGGGGKRGSQGGHERGEVVAVAIR